MLGTQSASSGLPPSPAAAALLARGLAVARQAVSTEENVIPAEIARWRKDSLGYVLAVFPWGQPGTILERHPGPDDWQREILEAVRDGLLTLAEAIRIAISSGHGIGKSALVAMLICWAIDTCEDCRGVVTANTESQLKGKTWPELAKWVRLGGLEARFELTATALISRAQGHARTWRIDQVTWSETNSEAFAGLHNEGRRILLVFDESSAIPEIIWETAEGALTDQDTEIIWIALGNPTRSSGRFHKVCFGSLKHRWVTRCIDARKCRQPNKAQIAQWAEDYGEDSDFFRVRVRGEAPRASSMQFIPTDRVAAARKRPEVFTQYDPLILALDFARGGDDKTVLGWRRGRSARVRKWRKIPGSECRDSMRVVSIVTTECQDAKPDAIFGDSTGIGGPVLDRLRQLGYNVIDVSFGGAATDKNRYANKVTEMWADMAGWLEGGSIPDDAQLEADLTGREYDHDKFDRLKLESKDDMKARGLASPDEADCLAMTFAYPVAQRRIAGSGPAARSSFAKPGFNP